MTQAERMEDIIKDPSKYGLDECLLCHARGYPEDGIVGMFCPDNPMAKRLGEPVGKKRILFYLICDKCYGTKEKTEITDNVEKIFLKELGIQ